MGLETDGELRLWLLLSLNERGKQWVGKHFVSRVLELLFSFKERVKQWVGIANFFLLAFFCFR